MEFSNYICCAIKFNLSDIISNVITVIIGSMGVFLALHFDTQKSYKTRQYKIIDNRNIFRINVITYLSVKLSDLDREYVNFEDSNKKNITNDFLVEIINKFNDDFLFGTLTEEDDLQKEIELFVDRLKGMLTTDKDGSLLELRDYMTSLISKLKDAIKNSKEKML